MGNPPVTGGLLSHRPVTREAFACHGAIINIQLAAPSLLVIKLNDCNLYAVTELLIASVKDSNGFHAK